MESTHQTAFRQAVLRRDAIEMEPFETFRPVQERHEEICSALMARVEELTSQVATLRGQLAAVPTCPVCQCPTSSSWATHEKERLEQQVAALTLLLAQEGTGSQSGHPHSLRIESPPTNSKPAAAPPVSSEQGNTTSDTPHLAAVRTVWTQTQLTPVALPHGDRAAEPCAAGLLSGTVVANPRAEGQATQGWVLIGAN